MQHCYNRLTARRYAAMEFLLTHLPQSDLDCYDTSLFLRFVDHALALRERAPWCAQLEDEIFYHYVLFPRVNDEDLSFHREIFHDALWERIKDLPTTADKVLEVNRWCHENASYQMQDERTASPLTVYRCGSGRCGEESAFLVSALRSVGLPARQVYSPRWAHCDDNHAWVEALCDGTWRFLGACEPEPVLDRGWFNSPASRALLVHSRVFGESSHPLHGERIGTGGCVTWYNQTSRYALTKRRILRAAINGQSAAGAVFHIQVLNEASFHTIATLTADENGEADIVLGLGDFHIFAAWGEYFAECDCKTETEITLAPEPARSRDTDWRMMDFTAPPDAPVNPAPLTDGQKRSRADTLANGKALREERTAAMCPDRHRGSPLILAARGNAEEILAFLQRDHDPRRKTLLHTLTDKDLRDAADAVLESHLKHLAPQGGLPDEIYIPFVLSPRIELEPLTPWRETLQNAFSEEEASRCRADPAALWHVLAQRIDNSCEPLIWTPAGAWRAPRCNERSLRILYIALLRTLGVPARLRPADALPEFWADGGWHAVIGQEYASLVLTSDGNPLYRRNWTLSRRTPGGWALLKLDDSGWRHGRLELSLPAGQYRIITSVRMPNGNQFAQRRDIFLAPQALCETALVFRRYQLSDLLRCQRLPVMSARTPGGERVADICRINGRPSLLFWLDEGGEPTEHILHELLAQRPALQKLPVNIILLPRGRGTALSPVTEGWREVRVLLDDWAFNLETVARHLTCDPDQPPLAVVCDREGNAVYGASGYSVGSVELLKRIAEYVADQ